MDHSNQKSAVIIGAGPAGLAAALELQSKTNIKPIIIEATNQAGGLAATPYFNGNRTELLGQRIYFGSEVSRQWWQAMCDFAPQASESSSQFDIGQQVSRIYHSGKLLEFPFRSSARTFRQLGLLAFFNSTLSRTTEPLSSEQEVENLEAFYCQRYGKNLYEKLFSPYSKKFWGTSCDKISAQAGDQRFEQFSASRSHSDYLAKALAANLNYSSKPTVERFWLPRNATAQIWTQLSNKIIENGGEIHYKHRVDEVDLDKNGINSVSCVNPETQDRYAIPADFCISTIPVKQLIQSLDIDLPEAVRTVANGLQYRDLITVGLLCKKHPNSPAANNIDQCLHIYDSSLQASRLLELHGRNPELEEDQYWISLDYLTNDGEAISELTDSELMEMAVSEANKMNLISPQQILDSLVLKIPKAYPVYSGSYENFGTLKTYLNNISNLELVGRNGLHQYNNIEHAIKTAIDAVSMIIKQRPDEVESES